MRKTIVKNQGLRDRRALRVRKWLRGTAVKPRMCVVKSNKHIQVQIIDDDAGHTLCATATFAPEFKDSEFAGRSKAAARKLGEHIAKVAKEKNIKEVIFDRGPFKYHGILAELANAARDGGLQF